MFGACFVNFTVCWRNANFYYLVKRKITLWIDRKKHSIYSWPKALLTKSSQLFRPIWNLVNTGPTKFSSRHQKVQTTISYYSCNSTLQMILPRYWFSHKIFCTFGKYKLSSAFLVFSNKIVICLFWKRISALAKARSRYFVLFEDAKILNFLSFYH